MEYNQVSIGNLNQLSNLIKPSSPALTEKKPRDKHLAKKDVPIEFALERSESRNQLILDTAYDAFVAMNEDGQIIEWNLRAQAVFGWSRDEVMGRPLSATIVPKSQRAAYDRRLVEFLTTGKSKWLNRRIEMEAVHRDGHEFPVELTISAVTIAGQNLFSSFIHDITDRKKAEAALRESENRVRSLAKFPDERPAPVLRVLPSGAIIYRNAASKALLELWNSEQQLPQHLTQLVASLHESSELSEIEVTTLDQHVYSLSFIPIREESYLNIFGTDVTEQKQAESSLRKAKVELESRVQERTQELQETNNKLAITNAELKQFAFMASHDMQAPLRRIVQYSQMLQNEMTRELSQNADGRKYLGSISKSAAMLISLVDNVLSFSHASRVISAEEINLNSVIKDILECLSVDIKQQNAQIDYAPMPKITATKIHLIQLFQNIIQNALKYSTPGVRPHIQVRVEDREDFWEFHISDNGRGIELEKRERVFEMFERIEPEKIQGSGIGLSTCKKIVETYGGRIWIQENLPVGSVFCFTFPKMVVLYD